MTKTAALSQFFSSFGMPAYASASVPDDVTFPYLTYELITGSFGAGEVGLTVNLWFYTTSEAIPNAKAEEIGRRIDEMAPLRCDGGAIWLKRGQPWCQSLRDETAKSFRLRYISLSGETAKTIKRRLINVTAEYLTQY